MCSSVLSIGVGIDTARYAHHVTWLYEVDGQLQPATRAFEFSESRAGYQKLEQAFQLLAQRHAHVHFHIRLDAAGQYAVNLESFLRELATRRTDPSTPALANAVFTISVGEPLRNRRYREAFSPKRKADPVDSYALARFAVRERPTGTPLLPAAFLPVRELASRLESQVRQTTRLCNQLHNLLARVFPEFDTVVPKLQAAWILKLLDKYPTPQKLAQASLEQLAALPHARQETLTRLHPLAQNTIASFTGIHAAQLVRQLVCQLRHSLQAQRRVIQDIETAYAELAHPNHIDSIPGIGNVTAAILTAKIVDIDRFQTRDHLVGYFGVFPEENSSGFTKDGQPKIGRQRAMSRKGNDLVRKYLWNCAKVAIRHNPAIRALYRRLRLRGTRGDVALGHCMRKLLHLVWHIWKTGKPFDSNHFPWDKNSRLVPAAAATADPATAAAEPAQENTAGHKGEIPVRQVVTAAPSNLTPANDPVKAPPENAQTQTVQTEVAESETASPSNPSAQSSNGDGLPWIDFAFVRSQVTLQQVLVHLAHFEHLRGTATQRRGPCPIHLPRPDRRHRTFSVNLDNNVFQCFHPPCAAHGNVLDLWAAIRHLPLREAALHLAQTFHLQLAPEQRRGTR